MNEFTQILQQIPHGIWLGGSSVSTSTSFEVINPGNGDVLTSINAAGPHDAIQALDIAEKIAPSWSRTSPRERSAILYRAFELIMARQDEVAMLMTLELGRVLAESYNEVRYGADYFRWFAEEAVRIDGRVTTAPSGNGTIMVQHEPVGPCLAITPWNFPLAMGTRKIGPAIAAGCPIIIKPAEDTPLTMLWLAQILAEAGLPAGVLSVLPTPHAAELTKPLFEDSRLRKISFTGSTRVGKLILSQAAAHVLRTSMELGGNAPLIVFEDAELDLAIEGAIAAKMRNGGQACTAANRIYVHQSLHTEFIQKFTAKVADLRTGPGWEPESQIGAIVNSNQLQRLEELIAQALSQGAELLTGGKALDSTGTFLEPTVLSPVKPTMEITQQEIFGPVATILSFEDETEVINQANATSYGLAAYFFTTDPGRMWRVSRALQYGMIGINRGVISDPAAPFGGYKESGLGREGGKEGIMEYLSTKYLGWL